MHVVQTIEQSEDRQALTRPRVQTMISLVTVVVLLPAIVHGTNVTTAVSTTHLPAPTSNVFEDFADLLRQGLFNQEGCDCCLSYDQADWVNGWAREQLRKVEKMEQGFVEARKVLHDAIETRNRFERTLHEEMERCSGFEKEVELVRENRDLLSHQRQRDILRFQAMQAKIQQLERDAATVGEPVKPKSYAKSHARPAKAMLAAGPRQRGRPKKQKRPPRMGELMEENLDEWSEYEDDPFDMGELV